MKLPHRPIGADVVINPSASLLGVQNAVLTGRARQYDTPEFSGPLSIKSVIRGSARWRTCDADRLVTADNYLILNNRSPYTLTIDSHEPTETFCLFFRQGFIEDACRVHSSEQIRLLDDPTAAAAASGPQPEFFETLHVHDAAVSPVLRAIHSRLVNGTATTPWLEDRFFAVASALANAHRDTHRRAAKIPAKKAATRVELYRRLLRGRDYMDSFFGAPVRLGDAAHQACLSPYHFHRLFREAFQETPNQYLQRKRLARARHLLESDDRTVTDICLEVGFESLPSFSGLFRRSFGCSPRKYRQRKRA